MPDRPDDALLQLGANAAYLEGLYRSFLQDPGSVAPAWRRLFEAYRDGRVAEIDHRALAEALARRTRAPAGAAPPEAASRQVAVLQLINAYRFLGHQQAELDPLGLQQREPVPELDPAYHGLTEADMDQVFSTGSLAGPPRATLREILQRLRAAYCGHVGAEYMHITDTRQKRWLQARLEDPSRRPPPSPERRREVLRRLVAAEGLEQHLHTRYVGQKRFSLEGAEALIPLLDELVQAAGAAGVQEIVMGMAHRGRLNVLVNVLGKPPQLLFKEFEGGYLGEARGWGDVKYHQGFSSDIETPGGPVHLALAFNPSHLEIIDPVVEGSVRARQDRRGDRDGRQVLPLLIHGDAAFAGQGVVMETLNLSQAPGFTTRGTVHVVVNNQIGFTTSNPLDARSTLYCTDVARLVQAPILHVNGDDPEAVLWVVRLALDFRMRFQRDVVVDLVCYRRHGHSEADEPAVTQPQMYRAIRSHPRLPRLYAERLQREGVIRPEDYDAMVAGYQEALERGETLAPGVIPHAEARYKAPWAPYLKGRWDEPVATGVARRRLRELAEALARVPEGFQVHPQVARILEARRAMGAGERPLDWGCCENLAYASLLAQGVPVRLSGQDSGRGTFFHRHAVIYDQRPDADPLRGRRHVPLEAVAREGGTRFTIVDSPLSEEAVLAFEYGYATAAPEALVIWEAQFGDFTNNAQVVVDQFLSAGEAKWGRLAGLVLFLPHGLEGQGPEHSSARPERYLQLCADENMQVCAPTTPAQLFHLLRRQALRRYRKPLVVLTPKSLLRHPRSVSALEELERGAFRTVLGEEALARPGAARRVVLCAGKVYYELLERREARGLEEVALVRIEQLHPWDEPAVREALAPFQGAREVVWCQEEPRNQGFWDYVRPRLEACLHRGQVLRYAGRPPYAAPAEGSLERHREAQEALLRAALGEEAPAVVATRIA